MFTDEKERDRREREKEKEAVLGIRERRGIRRGAWSEPLLN